MPQAGFEPDIPAGERLQTNALDRAATETGLHIILLTCRPRCRETRVTRMERHILLLLLLLLLLSVSADIHWDQAAGDTDIATVSIDQKFTKGDTVTASERLAISDLNRSSLNFYVSL